MQASTDADEHWKVLEARLAHKQSQRQSLRAVLTAHSAARDAPELSSQINLLNREIRQIEMSLDYAPTPFVSAEPVQPIAGLMPDERRTFAEADFSAFVEEAKQNITAGLKDPNSVQFRKLHVAHEGAKPVLCGELNAKNSYGGYVGFRRFYAMQRLADGAIDTDDSRFVELINRKCADLVKPVN